MCQLLNFIPSFKSKQRIQRFRSFPSFTNVPVRPVPAMPSSLRETMQLTVSVAAAEAGAPRAAPAPRKTKGIPSHCPPRR